LGIDDREDKLARFCLVTGTFTIEQYCKRWLLGKKHFEQIDYAGDLVLPLREYPVIKILTVYAMSGMGKTREIVAPELYSLVPDYGADEDLPFCLSLSPALKQYRGLTAIKTIHQAGYSFGNVCRRIWLPLVWSWLHGI
jgi:hypothetical protein